MRSLRKDQQALMFNMLIGAGLAVIMLFAILNIGTYINGTISDSLVDTLPAAASRTTLENRTNSILENVSTSYEDVVDIVVIAAIITSITIPLAAVVAVKRLF